MSELQSLSWDGELRVDEPLSKHTYYGIGGPADFLLLPKTKEDLVQLSQNLGNQPMTFLGKGSNVLVSDTGVRGLVLGTAKMNLELEQGDDGLVQAGASVVVSSFLNRASQKGWGGLEFLTGIPGSLGGVVFMNGGTHLGEAKDALVGVEVFDFSLGEFRVFGAEELKYEYRRNLFLKPGQLVWKTTWRVEPRDPTEVRATIQEVLVRRKSSQPLDAPSCGSVFKNPRPKRSWEVLDSLGLRGHQLGQAQFSEKHPNFIVNLGGAKASDVRGLIELAKGRAHKELGVTLEEEVRYLGDFSSI